MTPVRRLRPPLVRAGCWLMLATIILGLLAVSQGIRPDLLQRLQQFGFAIGISASLLTGIGAAIAAFMVSLPDRSHLWLLLPAPALFVWLSAIGYQCLTRWISFEPSGVEEGSGCGGFDRTPKPGSPTAEPIVRRLTAGGERIRTFGSVILIVLRKTGLS